MKIATIFSVISTISAIAISDVHTGFDPSHCPIETNKLPKGEEDNIFAGSGITEIESQEATNFFGNNQEYEMPIFALFYHPKD